jgi:phage tail-like protein
MAETKAAQKSSYPLPAYNFRVTVDGQSASFSEVSDIGIEYKTMTYRDGYSAWEGESITRYPSREYSPLSLKKGTVAGSRFLSDWFSGDQPTARKVAISLCDEAGKPLVVWDIREAIPTKLTAPTFDAATNQVSIETLDLLVRGVSVKHV